MGSRWVPGGRAENWPWHRSFLSRSANLYVRRALGLRLRDATGGFRAFRREALERLNREHVESRGYCFQVDLARRADEAGMRAVEVPIVFRERERGNSKMSLAVIVEAMWRITAWAVVRRWQRSRARLASIATEPAACPYPWMVPETTAYLDHAATTPMVPEAVAAFAEHAGRVGNPSSLHDAGRSARRVVEESRELIADRFGALPTEVVFTSGGTEANNLALKGFAWAGRAEGRERIIVSAIEHHAVLDPVDWLLEHESVEVSTIPVDRSGLLEITGAARRARRRSDVRCPRLGHGRQQRGGNDSAHRRGGDGCGRARYPGAQRRGAGGRPPESRLRRVGPGRDDDHRAQAWRSDRHRRAVPAP